MTSPFITVNNGTNDDYARKEDTVTSVGAAPVNNTTCSHRVIIDMSQDDSDDDDCVYMEVVEILDEPVPPEPSARRHHLNDVELFAQQLSDHSISVQHHYSPLSVAQNATSVTTTDSAFGVRQTPPRSTITSAKTVRDSNGGQSKLIQRNIQNRNNLRLSASNVPASDSIQSTNTEGRNGAPIHRYSLRQTKRTHNNNSATRAVTGTTTGHSPLRNDFSTGPSYSPTTNGHNHHDTGRGRSIRRRRYVDMSAGRRGNQTSPPHQEFPQLQRLRRPDGIVNGYHYHHRDHPGDGRLLNIDNSSYQDSVPIFGNGNENSGTSFTCILSQLPLVTVTKEDIIKSETSANGRCNHKQAEFNSDKYRCSICLRLYQIGEEKIFLPCCHQFHDKCMYKWLSEKGSCPHCKLRLDSVVHN